MRSIAPTSFLVNYSASLHRHTVIGRTAVPHGPKPKLVFELLLEVVAVHVPDAVCMSSSHARYLAMASRAANAPASEPIACTASVDFDFRRVLALRAASELVELTGVQLPNRLQPLP